MRVHVPSPPLEVCVVADCVCTEVDSSSDSWMKTTASPLTLIRHCACKAHNMSMNEQTWWVECVWVCVCDCACINLVLVRVLHEHTLLHAVGDDSISSKSSDVGTNHRKYFSNKRMQKPTHTSLLKHKKKIYNITTKNIKLITIY